jgi:DNA mismatch repair ATPase MutS
MTFQSILFTDTSIPIEETLSTPSFFTDLNLDQITTAITKSKEEYNLLPFFYSPVKNMNTLEYRHEIFRDLANENLYKTIQEFAFNMQSMREKLKTTSQLRYLYQKEGYFLDVIKFYAQTVQTFSKQLETIELRSKGFLEFRQYLKNYIASTVFLDLCNESKKIQEALSQIQYCLNFEGASIHVRKYEDEEDYRSMVEKTFDKFKQGSVKDHKKTYLFRLDMNHVEAAILNFVAQLYPETFSMVSSYYTNNQQYCPSIIQRFDREIQFYISYLDYIHPLQKASLPFCYPNVSTRKNGISATDSFDLALANKLAGTKQQIICNSFELKENERVLVVTGANQGGKTTFARTFGQLHYLAQLGCPIPGKIVNLFLFDHIFTHFEREESLTSLHGKLQDDLVRIHKVLEQATPQSIFILNEIFSSTTLKDAFWLGKNIIEKILTLDTFCVYVTFVDELSRLNKKTVSFVSTVFPENPVMRTYQIVRQPADGLSYALAIADKYHLTYTYVKGRIKNESVAATEK